MYPVAVVLEYEKKNAKNTLTFKTIHNTQNYKHNKVHVLHTLKIQNVIIQPNKEPKVEESALIKIWHGPYYTIMNWNNTIIQKTRNIQKIIQQRFNVHTIKVTSS